MIPYSEAIVLHLLTFMICKNCPRQKTDWVRSCLSTVSGNCRHDILCYPLDPPSSSRQHDFDKPFSVLAQCHQI
jgi:hypothetical protein